MKIHKLLAAILSLCFLFLTFAGCGAQKEVELTTENFDDYFDISLSLANVQEENNKDVAGFFASYWHEGDLCISIVNTKAVKATDVRVVLKINIDCSDNWYVQSPKEEIEITIPYNGQVEKKIDYKVKSDVSPLLAPEISDISYEIISVTGKV